MRKILILILVAVVSAVGYGQNASAGMDVSNYGVKIGPDKRVLVVLSALEMARIKNSDGQEVKLINTTLSEKGSKFRERLLQDMAGMNEDLRQRISVFVTQYKKRRPTATDVELVSPFISMAYTLSPVPEMADPAYTADLPGTLLDVLDFAPLAREFYRRSGISGKLDEYVKDYQSEANQTLRSSTREMVTDLLNYLHTRPEIYYSEKIKIETQRAKSKNTVLQKVETRDYERRFMVVPEMLAPAGNIIFLNVKDDYYLVLPPDKDLSNTDARRAFLQYVVDPLVLKNSKDIGLIREQVKLLLDERRKTDPSISPDVFLTISRSLVSAIDARQIEFTRSQIATEQARVKIETMKTVPEKRAVSAELDRQKIQLADETALMLSDAYERGAVMSFYFAEQLKGTENSGFDIASSLREMIATFDASKEMDRLARNADAKQRALAAREARRKNPIAIETAADNPVTKRLLDIQKMIEAQDLNGAGTELKKLAADNPSEPRIYYTIGRVASLAAASVTDPDIQAQKLLDAKVAYSNVLRTAKQDTDKALLSLTYVALARIYEFAGEDAYALQLYDKAIQLDDIAGGAFRDAIAGKQNLLKKQ
ncbi:MAG TPA: hypothetical protein PLP07_07160 [Pyrinomonadaceae bacterium]|nr:hypothetical protein [Chloracidobacterium sp.]MBP9935188.1 hypothetical protein [Pyrinomonadaceae bacterium]MBK7803042.1 hypothetical protein [Chloracidobacterium sp.]MBK9438307.1 hypothetical protein [Chloracidobacterium sp.]MBL0240807.1 hypothetical protein [Chloracidobacterium sp.]